MHLNVIHSNRLCVSSDRLPGPADRARNILSSVRKLTKISYSPHLIPAGGRFSQLDQSFAILLLYETPGRNYLSIRSVQNWLTFVLETQRILYKLFDHLSFSWQESQTLGNFQCLHSEKHNGSEFPLFIVRIWYFNRKSLSLSIYFSLRYIASLLSSQLKEFNLVSFCTDRAVPL